MLARSAVSRSAPRALCLSWKPCTRGYAATSPGSLHYQQSDSNGIQIASRDHSGAVSSLALVSKAGTRYQPLPSLAEALICYAFRNTERRSTLRIQRESELLGAELVRYHTRENLVMGAKFFRGDLPYFLELLAEVATQTKYEQHVMNEEVIPLVELNTKRSYANPMNLALDSVHGLAFHRGLGAPLHPNSSLPYKKYMTADNIASYAAAAYAKPNFVIVANGVQHEELSKWVAEFFSDVSAQPAAELKSEQARYYGGEERIAHGSGNSLILAFPGSSSPTGSSYKPEVAVLAALLGGQSSIKWSPGFSLLSKILEGAPSSTNIATKSHLYTDTGLLSICFNGPADEIAAHAPKIVATLQSVAKNVSEEQLTKAKALAKFQELESASGTQSGMEYTGAGLVRSSKPYQTNEVAQTYDRVTAEQVKRVAQEALANKASVSAVGDLHVLPYAEDIGLKV